MKENNTAYILSLTFRLLLTCVVVAALLGLVNLVTLPKITELKRASTEAAMKAVVEDPEAVKFSEAMELSADLTDAASAAGAQLTQAYPVLEQDGDSAGYALTVVASGSQGTIEIMVGVDETDTITGVSIVANSETPGIGSKVMDNEPLVNGTGVLDQFVGRNTEDMPLTVGSNVDAITGATVSSRGVAAGVNAALAVAGVLD